MKPWRRPSQGALDRNLRRAWPQPAVQRGGLWAFVNSAFGLFVLSTLFISGFSWLANEIRTNQQEARERIVNRQKLGMEIVNRLRYIDRFKEEFEYNDYHAIREAINGFIVGANVTQSHILHYGAIFPEYQSRSFTSLIWEVETLSDPAEGPRLRQARIASEPLERYISRLQYRVIPTPGQNPEGHREVRRLSNADRQELEARILSRLSFLRDPAYYEAR